MIEIKDLHKSFDEKSVLRGLNLTIQTGETMVIIGQSGCGKSVLLKLILGLLATDAGTIQVDGEEITTASEAALNKTRARIGMLFQGGALFDSLSVGENVGFSLIEHSNLKVEEVKERVRKRLEMVGLAGIETLDPAELSGGMKKRVALARAICQDPEIMFYDEPTTGLDPIMAEVINELICKLNKELKVTSIVVTHDLNSAYKVGNRIAMLYEGRIIGVGRPDEIRGSSDPVVQQFIQGRAQGPITERMREQRYMVDRKNN